MAARHERRDLHSTSRLSGDEASLADPATCVAAARFAGFAPPNPARARVLEIGCTTGHHLLPLAMRWPLAEFTDIRNANKSVGWSWQGGAVFASENPNPPALHPPLAHHLSH